MPLRPIMTALLVALSTLITLPAAAQSDGDAPACTPDADGNVPAGCPAGVALDP